jgi:hypothetical protein
MKIAVKECNDEELPVTEQKWQARGYTLTAKTDPKTLEVMEYMKAFNNKAIWVLARRDPD